MYCDFARNKAEFERTGLNFVETELELALTFCQMAKETGDSGRRIRYLQNAEKAHQSALKAFNDLSQNGEDPPVPKKFSALFKNVEQELSFAR